MDKISIHLCGAEGAGWAIDQDYKLTQQAILGSKCEIELVSLQKADVLHVVWDDALAKMDANAITGRYVLCHVSTNVYKMLEEAGSILTRDRVDTWLAQTKEACEALSRLGMPYFYVPYCYDSKIFRPPLTNELLMRAKERHALGIQDDEYLIGNFMRDSLGRDLNVLKPEKGADQFFQVLKGMKNRGIRIRVLLAGPRRHWLRRKLAVEGIPFLFLGRDVEEDDLDINILPLSRIAELYHLLDLYLITSRHEGGPRAVLEAAAACVPILSTPVGLAADILHPRCLFKSVDDAIEKVFETAEHGYPLEYIKQHAETVVLNHTPEAVALRLTELYKDVGTKLSIQVLPNRYEVDEQVQHQAETRWTVPVKRALARILRQDKPGIGICMCLWHNFHKPPYGGGNQFMMALGRGLAELGVKVVNNRIDDRVDVHVCNAIWFNPVLLEKLASDRRCRVIHRLDGIVHLARGNLDKSIDDYAYDFNKRFATATVMQSAWCLTQALGLGYQPIRPVIIHNSCDPSVFYRLNTPHSSKRIRLIATSWSDNPSKGSGLYKILEQHLDWTKFDFTFVGRTKETFTHIRHVQPMDSRNLAHMLRQHDIYITASRNEACSNALIEALACGLPALYLNDGGNPEVVGYGGLPFENENDMLDQLLKLADSRDAFRQCISISSLRDVAMRYLDLAKQVIKL